MSLKRVKTFFSTKYFAAYVCGERSGLVPEKPFRMGETLNGLDNLDINAEPQLAMDLLRELQRQNASEEKISNALKDLGIRRYEHLICLSSHSIHPFFFFFLI